MGFNLGFKGLNAELNPICYLLALLGAHHFLHVSRIKVNVYSNYIMLSTIIAFLIKDSSRNAIRKAMWQ